MLFYEEQSHDSAEKTEGGTFWAGLPWRRPHRPLPPPGLAALKLTLCPAHADLHSPGLLVLGNALGDAEPAPTVQHEQAWDKSHRVAHPDYSCTLLTFAALCTCHHLCHQAGARCPFSLRSSGKPTLGSDVTGAV